MWMAKLPIFLITKNSQQHLSPETCQDIFLTNSTNLMIVITIIIIVRHRLDVWSRAWIIQWGAVGWPWGGLTHIQINTWSYLLLHICYHTFTDIYLILFVITHLLSHIYRYILDPICNYTFLVTHIYIDINA